MKIILCELEAKLVEAWRQFFGEEQDVVIMEGDITTVECDAMVSPANSFGEAQKYHWNINPQGMIWTH